MQHAPDTVDAGDSLDIRPAMPPTAPAQPLDRFARAVASIDVRSGRGLEIGPLATPIVRKADADVYYVDVLSAEYLRSHYAQDPGVHEDDIVDLDFVLHDDGVTRPLADVVAPAGPYAWAVASHVIEHVPDVIAFLADAAALLADDGRLALVVPDRRYCFDALRPETTVGEMLLAHDNGDSRPSVRAVFDHFASAVGFSPTDLWAGIPADPANRLYPIETAWELAARRRDTDEYLDSHTWLFTPDSFIEQLGVLARLGQSDFTVAALSPTARNDYEFFVTLRRLPRGLSDEERASEIEHGFTAQEATAVASQPIGDDARPPATSRPTRRADAVTMLVSTREQRLLEMKRRVLAPVHRVRQRIGGRATR